jgi:Flp pilus assembly protein CpaB
VALAGLGTLVAWQQASGTPDRSFVVADRPIRPGESVTADDVRLVPVDLPDGVAAAAFDDVAEVVGRVALGPLGEGEFVQAAQVSEPGDAAPTAEVSFAVARDRAVDGRLGSGDLVDVFVTDDLGTRAVAERVQVVTVTDGGSTLTSASDLTVTLALTDPGSRADIVQAIRAGEVTLVRSTHLGPVQSPSGSPSPPSPSTPWPATPPAGSPGDATAAPPTDAGDPPADDSPVDTADDAPAGDGPDDGGPPGDSAGEG